MGVEERQRSSHGGEVELRSGQKRHHDGSLGALVTPLSAIARFLCLVGCFQSSDGKASAYNEGDLGLIPGRKCL